MDDRQINLFEDDYVIFESPMTAESTNKFPFVQPSDDAALLDFDKLKNFNGLSLVKGGDWFSRSDFDESFVRPIYLDTNRTGLVASDRHHWQTRMACDSINSPSPIRSWYQQKHRTTLENSVYYKDNPRTALALRKYIASQFRPTAAMAVYQMFNAKSVYDPCGGWGDRLVAAMALDVRYFCRDVNPLVLAGYASMQHMYGGNVDFEYAQSELSAPKEKFDLVFTSPPYWKAEKYQGDLSSHKQYPKFEDWLNNFLFKMIDCSWGALNIGGHFVLNVSDIYANHTYNKIVSPVLDYFKDHNPYLMGYRMAKRMNSKSMKKGIFCEPMIVVKKTKEALK